MLDDVERARVSAAAQPEGSIVAVLLEQHARIHLLFEQVARSEGEAKQVAFDRLRELLAIHETGEELVLRPLSSRTLGVGAEVARERTGEEQEAARVMARLEQLDVHGDEFAALFADFQKAVSQHASSEESLEFARLASSVSAEELQELGRRMGHVQTLASAPEHQEAAGTTIVQYEQYEVGPFAALLDKAHEAFSRE
ncbi:MAG TPA: hemerythrin domain-containing protein [Actinocrinis sp.]|nr:hemerythrin domain-containing protein [Actinocrinis sp.]